MRPSRRRGGGRRPGAAPAWSASLSATGRPATYHGTRQGGQRMRITARRCTATTWPAADAGRLPASARGLALTAKDPAEGARQGRNRRGSPDARAHNVAAAAEKEGGERRRRRVRRTAFHMIAKSGSVGAWGPRLRQGGDAGSLQAECPHQCGGIQRRPLAAARRTHGRAITCRPAVPSAAIAVPSRRAHDRPRRHSRQILQSLQYHALESAALGRGGARGRGLQRIIKRRFVQQLPLKNI